MAPRKTTANALVHARLRNQALALSTFASPAEVIRWLGALQAQDFPGAKWSIGLRLAESASATDTLIERAIAQRAIVRTWPMRGTLHFIAPEDVRWMLALLTPRVLASAARRHRELELDARVFDRAARLFAQTLQDQPPLGRAELMTRLERAKIQTANQRGYHLLWWAAQQGLICFGPLQGKEQTLVWLDDWVRPAKQRSREDSLAELARRYFASHGPATLSDFAWWSGLKTSDARAGLEAATAALEAEVVDGKTFWRRRDEPRAKPTRALDAHAVLLPGFDEFMLGYQDRSAAISTGDAKKIQPFANGQFSSTLLVGGRVVGMWRRTLTKTAAEIALAPFAPLPRRTRRAVQLAAERYARFLGLAPVVRGLD